jgi:L,D-peptidoglycan transpeptidase YkuD (ErfK/YbiS/YcfS/YnhG family)
LVKTLTPIHIHAISDRASQGILRIGNLAFPCLLGKIGRTFRKREGDGKSPRGRWLLVDAYFRPDRILALPRAIRLKPSDAWCDAPNDKAYNRKVSLPFATSNEHLWRDDEAYDILITTNHNQRPRLRGAGSAIFLHLWRKGATGTQGCIAIRRRDMLIVLSKLKGRAYLVI